MRSVLITGGTGFFGRAYVRHALTRTDVERICIFSRDEAKQAQMRSTMDDPRLRWFVGDVRDYERLERAMFRINTVIHGAALKRIEVGHYNPDEMVKTNILGTMNVINAAAQTGVYNAVMLSTDKAYQPVSPYGLSKAMAESLFIAANHIYGLDGPVFNVVRYGNVANSTGSVIPVWREQLKHGREVTVTDPECTRFWMNVEDSVALVQNTIDHQANALGKPIIPRLPAFRLADLAEAMGAKMRITGLPEWEKQHECMDDGKCSSLAYRMSVAELRRALRSL